MKQTAMAAMSEIKQEAMKKLMSMRTGDPTGRAQTERVLDLEAEVQKLNKQVSDNEQAVLKVRIMYKLKMMAFNEKCQRKVDEALADMNAMEKRKWEVQEETRLERDLLEQQLKVRVLAYSAGKSSAQEARGGHARACPQTGNASRPRRCARGS